MPTPNILLVCGPLITPLCYTLSLHHDTSSTCGGGCSDGVSGVIEDDIKAVGDVCFKAVDGCGITPDWHGHVKPDACCVAADAVCTTEAASGIKADGEDIENVKAVCGDGIKDDGGGDVKAEGDSCVGLAFIVGTDADATGDAIFADSSSWDGRGPVSSETEWW